RVLCVGVQCFDLAGEQADIGIAHSRLLALGAGGVGSRSPTARLLPRTVQIADDFFDCKPEGKDSSRAVGTYAPSGTIASRRPHVCHTSRRVPTQMSLCVIVGLVQ